MTISRANMQEDHILQLINKVAEKLPEPILKKAELISMIGDDLLGVQKQILSNIIKIGRIKKTLQKLK